MRLCVISNGFQEDYMLHFLDSLKGRVERIDFIGSEIYARERIDPSIRFYDLKGGGVEHLSMLNKVRRVFYYYTHLILFFLKNPRKGIIHLQWLRFRYLDGILLPLIYKLLGYKLVYTVHDIVPHDRDTRMNRFLFRMIYKLNWKLICHTEYIRKRLIDEFNITPEKIKVIRHGVYEVGEKELGVSREEALAKLGFDAKDKLILFFGFITGYKGVDLLLDAFTRLNLEPKPKLVIAGRVMDMYQAQFRELQEKYKGEHIRYMLRRIDEAELPLLFNAAEITALPYREASQSGVLFMSYAYGVPVLVPDIGGFPWDVKDGETGFIFRCGDVEDLRIRLEGYLGGKSGSTMFSRESIRSFAQENYSWDQSGKEFVEFLKA